MKIFIICCLIISLSMFISVAWPIEIHKGVLIDIQGDVLHFRNKSTMEVPEVEGLQLGIPTYIYYSQVFGWSVKQEK